LIIDQAAAEKQAAAAKKAEEKKVEAPAPGKGVIEIPLRFLVVVTDDCLHAMVLAPPAPVEEKKVEPAPAPAPAPAPVEEKKVEPAPAPGRHLNADRFLHESFSQYNIT